MSEWIIRLVIAALIPVTTTITGLIIHFSKRNTDQKTQTRDSTAAAMTAVTDASHDVIDIMKLLLDPLREENLERKEEIAKLELIVAGLNSRFAILVDYTNILRSQIIELGHDPTPFPDELQKHIK